MAVTDVFRSLRSPAFGSRSSIDDFLERWREELLSCLPGRLRQFLRRREQCLIVEPEGERAKMLESRNGEPVPVGELDFNASGSMHAMLAGSRGGNRRMVVRLSEDQILTREVSFPAQVRNNLAQVLAYEMDRLSPFRSDQVYFDYRALENPERRDKVRVELALCQRARVQDWLHRLRDMGAPADQVTWDGAWPKANLLPAAERPQRGPGLFSWNKLLIALVLSLGAAVLATPLWQMQQIRDERAGQIEELKKRAEKVKEVRAALELARQGSTAALKRKLDQPRMIDLLLELTDRLPDNTWVQNMDFRDGDIQIRGESEQATALINLLDQAPGITAVTFRSPVVQVGGSDRERFHISLKYKRPEGS